MSRRKRTTERSLWSLSDLENARQRVNDGESIRSVARSLEMNEATLRKRLKRSTPATSLGRYDTTFTPEMEQELCKYIKKIDGMYYGLTTKGLRELAFQYAEQNNIPHRFNTEKKMAGKEWLRSFRKRHPDLSLRQPTSTSIARAIGFNKPQCDRFFKNLSDLMDTYKFPPHSIFNMDETGISTVPNKPPKVISTKGKRCVNKISSAERGTNVTVVCAMSASGYFLPPAFIFARKRMKAELLDGSPPSSIGMVSDSSFINCDLFSDWLSHFKDHTKPSPENPILLILDNHTSHCSLKAVNFFRENNIHALTLPPHSSHRTQPLDRCFFNSAKKIYSTECEKWLKNHPGRAITPYQIASIFAPAYLKAATPANAVEGFKITGIYPYNPDVFKEEDFLSNEVTDRPEPVIPNTAPVPNLDNMARKDDNPLEITDDSLTLPKTTASVDHYPVSPKTPNEVIEIPDSSVEIPSTSRATPATHTENHSHTSIFEVAPLPRSENVQRSTRKKKKSDIISSSPYKQELDKDVAAKKKPKMATFSKPKTTTNTKPKTTTNTKPKTTTNTKPKTTTNTKPKTTTKSRPKKKIWKCGGCEEVYEEPICEDWIECCTCKAWWHEKCTAYINVGNFICDLCID